MLFFRCCTKAILFSPTAVKDPVGGIFGNRSKPLSGPLAADRAIVRIGTKKTRIFVSLKALSLRGKKRGWAGLNLRFYRFTDCPEQ